MNSPCQELAKNIGTLFTCSEFKEFIKITTPFIYPDGDVIDIFYRKINQGFILTDLGETMLWLESQSVSGMRNEKQKELIETIRLTHNLEVKRDMFISRFDSDADSTKLASSILELGQALVRLSDLWILQAGRKTKTILDSVEDFIKKIEIAYEREQPYTGGTDRNWRPHFYTTFKGNNVLTHVLNTDKKSSAKPILCMVNTQWQDLERYKLESNYKFISLIVDTDESFKIWTEGDKKLLSERSEVKKWSNKKDFQEALLAS
ncbi:MAG: hypothetical protein RLZZ04_1597 [Cyanobacteriota bacterium]|jgi:hypothetical protein